jgi:hypothetical protein
MVTRKESEVADLVGRRLEDKAGLDEDHAFHTQLLEYSENELYDAHTDCNINGQENDRAGTSLIYLAEPEGGGETSFPELGISVKAKKGMGLFFGSLNSRGKCNKQTTHVGAQVTKGKKRVLQRWYYDKQLALTPRSSRILTRAVAGGNTDNILCDNGNNCRHYMYNQSRVKGYNLGQKGFDLMTAGKMDEAEKVLKEALTYWPWDAQSHSFLGEVMKQKGDKESAITHFKAALETAGKYPDPHWFLGDFALNDKNLEEAAYSFQNVVDVQPRHANAWILLATALHGQGKSKDALEAAKKHLRIAPGDEYAKHLKNEINAAL